MDVLIDACAAVHARGMRTASDVPFLEVLDRAWGHPRYGITNAVKTECVRHNMGDWLGSLGERLVEHKNAYPAARKRQRELRKRFGKQAPGVNDAGLQLLAQSYGALLVTDDGYLYATSRELGLRCADLFDLALALEHGGQVTRADLEALFTDLRSEAPSYHPFGWKGIARAGGTWAEDLPQLRAKRRPASAISVEVFPKACSLPPEDPLRDP